MSKRSTNFNRGQRGISAGAWFYSQPGFRAVEREPAMEIRHRENADHRCSGCGREWPCPVAKIGGAK